MPIFWKEVKTELCNKKRMSVVVFAVFFCIYVARKNDLQDVMISVFSAVVMLSIYGSVRNAYCFESLLATPMNVKQYCGEKGVYVGIKILISTLICFVAYALNVVKVHKDKTFIDIVYTSLIIILYVLVMQMNMEVVLLYLSRKRFYLIYILCSVEIYILREIVFKAMGLKQFALALVTIGLQYICFSKLCSGLNYERIERGWS